MLGASLAELGMPELCTTQIMQRQTQVFQYGLQRTGGDFATGMVWNHRPLVSARSAPDFVASTCLAQWFTAKFA